MQLIPIIPQAQFERERLRKNSPYQSIWEVLDEVKDPEIPVLSLWDMGVLRNVEQIEGETVVTITPTYSGCPAMDVMQEDIENALKNAGISPARVAVSLSPAWTTDWLSEKGRKAMHGFGIAPPEAQAGDETPLNGSPISCPQCESDNTELVSEFGSTACKALFRCNDCHEVFDYFKPL